MRRWVLRISISLAILIVAIFVIVQAVLWSPLPKRIVIQQIEKGLGLRISAASLSTSWMGKAQLEDVSLGLPLSPNDFLKVKTLTIHLNSLFTLALGEVTVKSIEIDNPTVEVVQNAQGLWNFQQVIELLGRAGGAASPQQQSTDTSVPKLPNVKLVNGSINITDNQKHTSKLEPLNITGQPNGALVWQYDLSIANSVALTGKVAPGGNWQHEIQLSVQHLDPLLKDWGIATTYDAVLKADWRGQLSAGNVVGQLTMDQVTAKSIPTLGDISVTGAVKVQTTGAVVTLNPENLNVHTTYVTLPDIGIQSGSFISDSTGLHAQSVKVKALGGLANLDGKFDPSAGSVDLQANWSGLSLATRMMESGSLTGTLRQPFANQPVIDLKLADKGTVGNGTRTASQWDATMELTGQGTSWRSIDWLLTTPQLTYTAGKNVVNLSGLNAHVSERLPVIELTNLSLPTSTITTDQAAVSLNSFGKIDYAANHWNFDATGGFNTTFQGSALPITVAIHTLGNSKRYDLKHLVITAGDITVSADGSYDQSNPTPVDLHVQLTQAQHLMPEAPVQGEVAGDFKIVGVLFAEEGHVRPYLTTTGDLRSSDLVLLDRPIGDIDIKLQGTTSSPKLPNGNFGPMVTQIHTTDFSLFQGTWGFSLNYPNKEGAVEAVLETQRLPIEELARFAKIKNVRGQLTDAKWTLIAPSLSLSALELHSEYHLADLNGFGAMVETLDATADMHDGVLQLYPLTAKNGNGTLTTTASIDLKNPQQLVSEITIEKWPFAISDTASAHISAHSNLDIDLKSRKIGASGALTAATDLLLGGAKIAHLETHANIRKRSVELDQLKGNVLTGNFTGSSIFDLDKPLQATGQVVWDSIDAGAFATVFPALDGLGGKFSGNITLGPAHDPRPLEPIRIDINVAADKGHFRSMRIGSDQLLMLHAVGYLNTDRAVLDHSDLFVAGGVMHLWARLQNRATVGIAAETLVDFQNLQLNQLAHIDTQITQPMPGLLSGQFAIVRGGTSSKTVIAQLSANLLHTDLANFGPIAALYNIVHIGANGSSTDGRGSINAVFEQNTLRISAFRYFNHGIDADGIATVGPLNFKNFSKTPVGGQVVGTAQAFKDTQLPLLGDFDTLFGAFQSNLSTIDIGGNLNKPTYSQGLASDIGKTLQQLIVGDVQAGQRAKSN